MRIAIITYDEYINIPYIQKYEKHIIGNGDDYDVILWDRRGCGGEHPNNHYVFQGKTKKSKLSKIIPFLQWRCFTLKILQAEQYDKLVILTTIPGILIFDLLIKKYKGNFFFDLRDFTYEGFGPYKKLVNLIVSKSAVTSISSKAFMKFLVPAPQIVVAHNISNDNVIQESLQWPSNKKRLTIGFVGGIRYFEENCLLLTKLKNSAKYSLRYVGKVHAGCDLEAFSEKNNITNAEFFPAYDNSQKPEIYRQIDLINAVYGNKSPEVKLALPNKLYDCVIFKKPIIVSQGTYLAEIVEQYHLGIAIDIEKDDIEMTLDKYLAGFDARQFEEGCREFLKLAQQEEMKAEERITNFLKERIIS